MVVRSRSSLHVRQDSDLSLLPPPSKRPRIQHLNPLPSSSSRRLRRRGSSPDLLDTTIELATTPKPLAVRPANSPLSAATAAPLPRASARRPRLISSASASTYNHRSPPSPPPPPSSSNNPNTPHFRNRHDTPSTTPIPDPRESPDPLDTISPAPAISSPRPRPPALRESRYHRPQQPKRQPKIEEKPAENPVGSDKTSRNHASRNSQRNNSLPPPESQPPPAPASAPAPSAGRERRSLRSHDSGPKFRSELAAYFPNYDQLLSLEPQKTEFLTGDTTIQLIDDLTKPPSTYLPSDPELPFGNPLVKFHNCKVIQLPEPKEDPAVDEEDPLNEGTYFRAHRRVERQEKQLRNIERERAQHEKLQVDRLLEELRGHDWLRVMGIAATDNKKLYEPKRDFFVKELSALIEKFRIWKEEEKRRKLVKDKPSSPDVPPENDSIRDSIDVQSNGEPADLNDVDVQAARQLHREARTATSGKKPKPSTSSEKRRKSKTAPSTAGQEPESQPSQQPPQQTPLGPEPLPPVENKPFTSFYSDPQVRAIALGKGSSPTNRRTNRLQLQTLAFGHPIPEMEEQEFELPPEILTEDAILASQRKQRRMRRDSRRGQG